MPAPLPGLSLSQPQLGAASGGSSGSPSKARFSLLTLLTRVLLIVPGVLFAVTGLGLMWLAGRPSLLPLVMLSFGFTMLVRSQASLKLAKAAITPERAAKASVRVASGRVTVFDPTDDLDHLASALDGLPGLDVPTDLPALHALVDAIAIDVGVAAPASVQLRRAGWSVRTSVDGTLLSVGSAFLLVASIDELRAEIVRCLAQLRDPRWGALREARVVATAALWSPPHVSDRLQLPFRPAMAVARSIQADGERAAREVRDHAEAEANRIVGVRAAAIAAQRATVSAQVWREHLAGLQRVWATDGRPVAPHEEWRQAWVDVSPGRAVLGAPDDVALPIDMIGWTDGLPAAQRLPECSTPCAFESLAGERTWELLRKLDEGAASQYFERDLNEHFGAAGVPVAFDDHAPLAVVAGPVLGQSVAVDDVADQAAASTTSQYSLAGRESLVDPATVAAYDGRRSAAVGLIHGQLHDLEQAMVRRDVAGLALAQALSGPEQAPVVQMHAAGVRWLCGDPRGADAIRDALRRQPRAASVLVDLVPALRSSGRPELAAEIEQAERAAAQVLAAPIVLRRIFNRSTKLQPVEMPAVARAALAELVSEQRGLKRAWITDAVTGPGPFRPAVLVVQVRFLSGWVSPKTELVQSAKLREVANLIWPMTSVEKYTALEGRGRKTLRKRIPPLWTYPGRKAMKQKAEGRA